jgi:hypothetical protein
MLKILPTAFAIALILLFGAPVTGWSNSQQSSDVQGQSGQLQKIIVETGSVTMQLDVNKLNGNGSTTAKLESLHLAVAADSFFSILVFNDLLRGAEQGSMALLPQNSSVLSFALNASVNQLTVDKLALAEPFDLAVRDAKTGFTFFNVAGHQYEYDAKAQALSINHGRLLLSHEFATALGRPSDAGLVVGTISIGAAMEPIEISEIINGETKSVIMPALHQPLPGTVPGPDVIVGELHQIQELGNTATQVGVAIGTISCNAGTEDLDWFALPNTDHPVIPQNLYRMSGGANNDERFEQVGQS